MNKICAISIKQIWYADPLGDTATALTPAALKTKIAAATEIDNVHQETWSIDEAEPSQDSYRNQLTGSVYRFGKKTMGDVTFNFVIGQYDYTTKAALMGGKVITDTGSAPVGWERPRGAVEMKKMMIALTNDGVYCVLPYANVAAREAYTDGASAIAVVATMMEPPSQAVAPEYWFEQEAVDK